MVAVAGVLSGLVFWSCLRAKKEKRKKKPATRKSFFASWFSHCNVIGRNDTSLLVHKWKPRVITSFGFWKKIYRSFPFVELNPGAIRGLDVVFVPPKTETERNIRSRYRNGWSFASVKSIIWFGLAGNEQQYQSKSGSDIKLKPDRIGRDTQFPQWQLNQCPRIHSFIIHSPGACQESHDACTGSGEMRWLLADIVQSTGMELHARCYRVQSTLYRVPE